MAMIPPPVITICRKDSIGAFFTNSGGRRMQAGRAASALGDTFYVCSALLLLPVRSKPDIGACIARSGCFSMRDNRRPLLMVGRGRLILLKFLWLMEIGLSGSDLVFCYSLKIRAMAWADIPEPSPVKPNLSSVVALTLTASMGSRRSSAIF